MGYYINQAGSKFRIEAANVPAAHKALQGMAHDWLSRRAHMSFVNLHEVQESVDILDAMYECRWELEKNLKTGDIIGICFIGEKSGEEEVPLEEIAPWVESGSYIEMGGEDGERWRYVFKAGKMHTVHAQIVWPEPSPG